MAGGTGGEHSLANPPWGGAPAGSAIGSRRAIGILVCAAAAAAEPAAGPGAVAVERPASIPVDAGKASGLSGRARRRTVPAGAPRERDNILKNALKLAYPPVKRRCLPEAEEARPWQ